MMKILCEAATHYLSRAESCRTAFSLYRIRPPFPNTTLKTAKPKRPYLHKQNNCPDLGLTCSANSLNSPRSVLFNNYQIVCLHIHPSALNLETSKAKWSKKVTGKERQKRGISQASDGEGIIITLT